MTAPACPDGFDPIAGLDPASPAALRVAWARHAAGCPTCGEVARDHAIGRALLDASGLPEELTRDAEAAPARPASPLRRGAALAAAIAAALVLTLRPPAGRAPRSAAPDPVVTLTVARDGAPAAQAAVGDVVRFTVTAAPSARVWVWVQAPDGVHSVGAADADASPTALGEGDAERAWQVDQPGEHVFFASALGEGACPADGCARWTLSAR